MQRKNIFVITALALLCAGSMWFYVQRIMVPKQEAYAAVHAAPRGNLSDLYPRWLGARELLLNHRDPYSREVTRDIQFGYYGRPLDPSRADDPLDQQGFAYPLYVVFLLAPFVHLPFHQVQVIWFWILLVCTAGSVLFWLGASNWRPSPWTAMTLIILTLGSFPAVQALKLQQLTLLVAALLAASCALLMRGRLVLPGVLLAVSTIKPQLVILLAGWLLLWSMGDWKARWSFIASFAGSMAILFAGSQIIFPGWIAAFIDGLKAYRQYTGGAESCLDVLFTPLPGLIISVLLVLALLAIGWCMRRVPPGSSVFALMTSLALTLAVTSMTKVAPYNHLLLLPAVFFLIQHKGHLKTASRSLQVLTAVTAVMLVWPWMASVVLFVLSFFLSPENVQRGWMVPLYTSIGMPIAIAALLVPFVISLWNQRVSG